MAAASVSSFEVGSYFITQYYRVLKESPEYSHQFYNDSSTMTRVDADDTQTVSNIVDIHALLSSLNVTGVEVTKLHCQESWNGGILLIVSGVVKSRNFSGKRKFTQAFFLAPQEKGYFVLNDVLQFIDEVPAIQHPITEISEIKVDSEVHASNHHLEQPVSDYELDEETETVHYVDSIHIEDDSPIDKYSLPDEPQHEELQPEIVVKEAPVEESPPPESAADHVSPVEVPVPVPSDEPAREPAKLSYASILRAKALASQSAVSQPPIRQNVPPPSEHHRVQTSAPQLNPSASSYVPETGGGAADEGLGREEGLLTSVYVRSLPSNVTNLDLEQEFKKFGKIKHNGVFIRNKRDVGICFAFVEFEDMSGVHTAVQASPIELLGRQVYIEERRASSNTGVRGGAVPRGGRGRGRGTGYQNESSRGRGGIRNSGRGIISNGFQQHASQ